MLQISVEKAILATLAFFGLYDLPLPSQRIWELLGTNASFVEVDQILKRLVQEQKIVQVQNLFGLKKWDTSIYDFNQQEIAKKWRKVERYFNWLALLPFVRQISVINSLALGTADSDSDIDFFVVTRPKSLYFVRSVIIVLFRMLGVYKTREKIKDRFCFGFFVTLESLPMEHLMIQPLDPYFVFWLANMRPIFGQEEYLAIMKENAWVKTHFPNLEIEQRLGNVRTAGWFIQFAKFALEILLWLPIQVFEPILRKVHIQHTFKLQENRASTSTTKATPDMLKLHGSDVRAEIADRYNEALRSRL